MFSPVAVILADGFEEVEAVTPIDFLRRADIPLLTAHINDDTTVVKGAHSLLMQTDHTLSTMPEQISGIILPGGMPGSQNLSKSYLLRQKIASLFKQKCLVAAICAAPSMVLGKHGLLRNRKFTGYPGTESQVQNAHYVDKRVVMDKNLITSKGAGTAAEFACAIIQYFKGKEAALAVWNSTIQNGEYHPYE